jgi:hypothetical protein
MKDIRRAGMLAVVAMGVMLSSACAGGTATPSAGGDSGASASPSSSAGTNTGGANTGGTTTGGTKPGTATSRPGTASGSGSGSDTSGSGAGAAHSSECRTRDLLISDEAGPKPAAALQHTEYLVFRNTTDETCTLQGYPGVSFVAGDSGTQVGSAFVRTSAHTSSVRLTPGSRAYALITLTEAPNACSPVSARGYRVYPPDETNAVFVPKSQLACTDKGQSVGTVSPISTTRPSGR